MTNHAFIGLDPPVGVYRSIFDAVLKPDKKIKQIDICCGLGFGKTNLAIQLAALTLNLGSEQRGLFLEPDWDRVDTIFLRKWRDHVPDDLYTVNVGKSTIVWHNGAELRFRPRIITGSRSHARDKNKGVEYSFVIDDESAILFDLEQYQNTFARIRVDANVKYYLTLSTPKLGAYGRFIKDQPYVIRGRTRDNHYLLSRDPEYETRLRKIMSPEQARRELDGEFVALEGRIWKEAKPDVPWPDGNRCDRHPSFDPQKQWWLFCDFGGATGAYVVIQQTEPIYRGVRQFSGPLWVAVADLCPRLDASASRAFDILDKRFGIQSGGHAPSAVTGGVDGYTRSSADGLDAFYFAHKIWSNVSVFTQGEDPISKQRQYDSLSSMIFDNSGNRRFTIARNFVSLEPESHRGVREMFDEDEWPPEDKRRPSDILPKNKEITVQHVRDALLMGSALLMNPPLFGFSGRRPG